MLSKSLPRGHRLPRLTKVTLIALVINTLAYAAELPMLGHIDREVSIVVALLALVCGLVATGWRWTPALAALLAGGILYGNPFLFYNLGQPVTSSFFLAAVTQVVSGVIVVLAGVAATLQNYRR